MRNINISQIDTLFLNGSYPIEFLFFYKDALQIDRIRLALRKLSRLFWPVFGFYDTGKIHAKNYIEQDIFDEEIRRQNFDIFQPHESLYERYRNAIPFPMNTMIYLKFIQYNNGTVLIVRMEHLVGDAYSYFYFLSILSALSQSNYVTLKNLLLRYRFRPRHNRTILKSFLFTGRVAGAFTELIEPKIHFESISRKSIQERIRVTAKKLNQSVSANDVLCAMIIKAIAENYYAKFTNGIQLSIPIDIRQQILEYGPRFFGNGLLFHKICFYIPEVIESDIEQLSVKIRKSMPQISADHYVNYLKQIEDKILEKNIGLQRPYDPGNGWLVTNLSRLPTHRLDFGKGKPDLVFLLTVGKNSTAILSNRENFVLRYVY